MHRNLHSLVVRGTTCALLTLALTACGPGGASNAIGEPAAAQTNNAPQATADTVTVMANVSTSLAVLTNDSDGDGDPLSILSVGTPTGGTAHIDADTIVYAPSPDFTGSDWFSYTVSDGRGGRATAGVTVTVAGTAAVTVRRDSAATPRDQAVSIAVLANDDFAQGTPSLIDVSAPGHGTVVIDDNATPGDPADDTVVYTPQTGYVGPDSFLYTASNAHGSGSAAVQITIGHSAIATGVIVCGALYKGPIAGAQVSLYAVDNTGMPAGAPIAQALTDSDGAWCATVPGTREPMLVVSSGGAFDNEADAAGGLPVTFAPGEGLATLLPATEDYAATTIYSNALLHRARADSGADDFFDVYLQRRALFTAALGLDPVSTAPTPPSAPRDGAPPAALDYALALGGMANAVHAATTGLALTAPTHAVIDALVRDLSDCVLDGLEAAGAVLANIDGDFLPLPTGIDLNLEILRFRNNRADAYAGTPPPAFDAARCTPQAAAAVPVTDATPPVFSVMPAPIDVVAGSGTGVPVTHVAIANLLTAVAAVDNNGGVVAIAHDAPDVFPLGETVVTFTATDHAGNASTGQSAVTATLNLAPTLVAPLPDQAATQGVATNLALAPFFVDPEGAPLSFTLTGLPSGTGLSIDPASGVISGTPLIADAAAAPLALTATASDTLLAVSASFTLTVLAVNVAPQITGQTSPLATPEETPLAIVAADVQVSDPDDTVFNLALAPGANYALAGNTIVPDPDFNGDLIVPVTVDDGTDVSAPFALTVTVTAVNDLPTISAIADPAPVAMGTPIGPLTFTVGDVETAAGALVVTAISDNQTLMPDAAIALGGGGTTRDVNLNPAAGQTGTATITVVTDDGANSVSTGFTIVVFATGHDTDGDGINDDDEVNVYLTNPIDPDTDGDDVRDGIEVLAGGDPLAASINKVYVDPLAAGGDGQSWANAHQNLNQAATAIATGGAPGDPMYVLIGDTRGQLGGSDWALSLTGAGCTEVVVLGSVSPASVLPVRDANGAPTSVLDVQGHAGPGLSFSACTNARVFDVHVRGGVDGGVDLFNSAEVDFTSVWITDNSNTSDGGGVSVRDSGTVATLRDVVIADNAVSAGNGGGLAVSNGGDIVIESSELRGNLADDEGGGFFVGAGSTMTMRDSLVRGNLATTSANLFGGGGGSVRGGLTMDTTIVADNRQIGTGGQPGGGAIYVENDRIVTVRNSMLLANFSQADGGAILAQRIGAPVTLHNNLIVGNANDVGLGGGMHAVSINTGRTLSVTSNTFAYNQTLSGLGGFQSGGGIDLWGNTDDTVLRDNIAWFNDDDVGGLQVDDNYYRHGSPPVTVEHNNFQTSTVAGSFGNIAASPLFQDGFYLHQTVSQSVGGGSQSAAAAGLAAPFTTAIDGTPDTVTLDQGFHYGAGSVGVADTLLLTDERASCATGTVNLVFAVQSGGFDTGPGRIVTAQSGAGNTAGGTLRARTALTPFGVAGSVLAIDQGTGEYRVEITGVDRSPGNVVELDVRVDSGGAPLLTLASSELDPLFVADGC